MPTQSALNQVLGQGKSFWEETKTWTGRYQNILSSIEVETKDEQKTVSV